MSLLMQYSLGKHPDLPNVPLVMDLAKTDEQRTILKLIFGRQVMGRPFAAPLEVRKDRVDALRNAFMKPWLIRSSWLRPRKQSSRSRPYQARRSRASYWKFIATRRRKWRRRWEMR